MKKLILTLSMLLFTGLAQADYGRYGGGRHYSHHHHDDGYFWDKVARRMDRQWRRIERGRRNGELTRWEIRKLEREQRRIAKKVNRVQNKHRVRQRDFNRVIRHLDRASDNIHRLKNNDHYRQRVQRYYNGFGGGRGQVAWGNGGAGFYFRY